MHTELLNLRIKYESIARDEYDAHVSVDMTINVLYNDTVHYGLIIQSIQGNNKSYVNANSLEDLEKNFHNHMKDYHSRNFSRWLVNFNEAIFNGKNK